MFVPLYDFFHKRLWLCHSLFVVLFLVAGGLATQLKFTQDIASMLPDSKALKAMNEIISGTRAGEQLVFLASFKDSTHIDPERLIAATEEYYAGLSLKAANDIDTITMQVGGLEEVIPELVENYLPVLLNEEDFLSLDTLLSHEKINSTLATNKSLLLSPAGTVYKSIVAADPVGISALVWKKFSTLQYDPNYEVYDGYLFTKDHSRLTFFLKPKKDAKGFYEELEQYTSGFNQRHPTLHITYFGGPAVAHGNASQLQADTVLTLSITVLLLLLLTYYYFRKKRTPLLLLVPVAFGAAVGLATIYMVQGHISLIALGAGAIVLGIAMDYSIHFLAHARESGSMRDTVKEMQQPLTLGSFTTIAAFYSLRFVNTAILQDLGLFAAASLVGAALCTLVFLPHFPLGNIQQKQQRSTVFDRLGRWQPEKKKWLVLAIFLLTPFMVWQSFNVEFDEDLMHLNYLTPAMRKAQQEVSSANAYALSSIFVVAEGKNEEQALNNLLGVTRSIDSLKVQGSVRTVSNPATLLSSLEEQDKRIARWNDFWTIEKKNQVLKDVKLAAANNGFNPEAFGIFEERISKPAERLDTTTAQIIQGLFPGGFANPEGKAFAIAALKVDQQHRSEVFQALEGRPHIIVTDRQQGATQLVSLLSDDFNNIAIYTSLIVFFALLIGYGRIELAIISFLPMAISWVWILGLMAILGVKFNIVNIIISTLIFGLGDDYTIFTMDGLVQRFKHGKGKLTAVRSAVYLSVCTVLIGLGVLLLAKHPALKSIAFISITGLLCVLLISQTLQPFLFNWFIQKRADKGFHPFTLRSFLISLFAFLYFFFGCLLLTALGFIFTKLWPFNKEKGKYHLHVWLSRLTWSMMYVMGNVKKKLINKQTADFNSPAIYIANHSSFLDILVTTMLHPKFILLTNKWVWNSPVFGKVIRMAEYYPVSEGADDSVGKLEDLVKRGYSIIIFPEGTRSTGTQIGRFRKGAFYLAEKLQLDIAPLLLHGIHYSLQKGDWLLKDGICRIIFHHRISPENETFGKGYRERTKTFSKWYRMELEKAETQYETPKYYQEQLLKSYTYKGPILEWYCRIKSRLEQHYEPFHKLIPRSGKFYDLGCGNGFMTYMLHWAAKDRTFIGVDYDEEKIATAQNQFLRTDKTDFFQADLSSFEPQACDGIFLLDVLHYLLPQQQELLLERCAKALQPGGVIIIRDGLEELGKRHRGTRLSELFSTTVFGFNKTTNNLHFLKKDGMAAFAKRNGLGLEMLDTAKLTSNVVFILKKSL